MIAECSNPRQQSARRAVLAGSLTIRGRRRSKTTHASRAFRPRRIPHEVLLSAFVAAPGAIRKEFIYFGATPVAVLAGAAAAPVEAILDNGAAQFSTTGTWPTSTAVGGFFGANYQVHAANGEEPTAIVVDNTSGTTVGTWPTSTSVSGFFGTNYQVHAAGSGTDSFTWTPTIPTTGSYQVYARWTIHPNRTTHAVYTVNHAGGATPVTVNQEINGGTWQLLGSFTLNAGSSHTIVLLDQGDGYVIADAIKVVPEGAAPNTATWTPAVPTAKAYRVYARWTAHPNRATDARYTVTHAGGDTLVTVNQEQNNGAWFELGTFNMAPGAGHKVSLTDQANGYVIADAIRLIGTDEPQVNSAAWSPNLAGEHQVYAKWTANANRATNATYAITHAGGTTQVTVNQQVNGGQFNLLGSFTLTPASTITLTDNANGFVIADAIQLISAAPPVLALYFVHTDHLNTPRVITNQTNQVVWRWDQTDPFGGNVPDENPSGLGSFTCNLRLPGQYFDKETNLHYNYFRDYDPAIGRYIQSDPIGLAGGFNTYLYATDPLTQTDLFGLMGSRGRVTYCGSGWNKPFVPESFGGASFSQPCKTHDECYDKCGASKLDCDEQLYYNLIQQCNRLTGELLRDCKERALAFFVAVSYYSGSAFTNAQAKACAKCKK